MSNTAASSGADLLPLDDAVAFIEAERNVHFAHDTTERLRVLKQILRGEFPPPAEEKLPQQADDDSQTDWTACHWKRENLAEWLTTASADTPDASALRAKRWAGANAAMNEQQFASLASHAARYVIKGEGEWRHWHDRYHPAAFIGEFLLYLAISGIVSWVLIALIPPISALDSILPRGLLVTLIVGAYGAIMLWRFLARVLILDYTLTEERLIAREGLLSRIEREARVLLIKDISAHADVVQRFIGLGDVVVHADDHDTPHVVLRGIKDPFRIKELIWQVSETDKIEKCYFIETGNAPRA